MPIRQNIEIDTLEEFRELLGNEPDKGKMHLEAKATYEGQAGRSLVQVGQFALDDTVIDRPSRQYTFPFGAWQEVEDLMGVDGTTDRVDPVEMVLASIAACLAGSVSVNAARLGIDTEGMEVKVSTTFDPRVFLALQSPDERGTGTGAIEYEVKVKGDISDEDIEMIHKLCRYSPVHGMMSESISITGEVTRV